MNIFSNLNLEVEAGEFVVVIGKNGAGKSTLLNLTTGTEQPDSGRLIVGGQDITNLPAYKRSEFIGRVHQNPELGVSPSLTVLENLALASARGKTFCFASGVRRRLVPEYVARLRELNMGLEEMLHHKAGQLSGGQKQALALTMVTIARPKLLLLDEHTAALDPQAAERICQLTAEIISQEKLTAIMITHDLTQSIAMGNRLLMLDRGKFVKDIRGQKKRELTLAALRQNFETVIPELAS